MGLNEIDYFTDCILLKQLLCVKFTTISWHPIGQLVTTGFKRSLMKLSGFMSFAVFTYFFGNKRKRFEHDMFIALLISKLPSISDLIPCKVTSANLPRTIHISYLIFRLIIMVGNLESDHDSFFFLLSINRRLTHRAVFKKYAL